MHMIVVIVVYRSVHPICVPIHRAVLDQGFVWLFSSFVSHCLQLSIVGGKDSEFLK